VRSVHSVVNGKLIHDCVLRDFVTSWLPFSRVAEFALATERLLDVGPRGEPVAIQRVHGHDPDRLELQPFAVLRLLS